MSKLNININQKIDLINNYGLSACNGQAAQQHHDAFGIFNDFLCYAKPGRILEIGTALGGLTAFFGMIKNANNLDIDILSYDIHEQPWYSDLLKYSISIKTKNIFNEEYNALVDLSIIDYIQKDRTTIVVCDGGCKKCEFNILSPYLKTNDIIMVHDYAPSKEYFQNFMNLKIWNWHEIEDSDIINSINAYNINKHEWYEKFLSVAWGCFIKQ